MTMQHGSEFFAEEQASCDKLVKGEVIAALVVTMRRTGVGNNFRTAFTVDGRLAPMAFDLLHAVGDHIDQMRSQCAPATPAHPVQ